MKYDITPATTRQVNAFYKKQNNNALEWSSVLLANLLQVTNGKSNTQQINKSLNLQTTRFKNGNLKQLGVTIKAYIDHVIKTHSIGIVWKDERFQFVESVALDIETVIPFHIWQAEAEAKAEKEKAEAKAEKEKAEAAAKQLKAEKAAALAAKKAAEKAAVEAKKAAEKAAAEAEAAQDKAAAEAAEKAAVEAEAAAKVEAAKVAEAEAKANGLDKAIKAERDRLIAAGSSVKAASLLVQLERALLAGIAGGTVSQLQAIAKAAGELQIMAAGMAMEAAAQVEDGAAMQLVDVKPTAQSKSAGLKKVS